MKTVKIVSLLSLFLLECQLYRFLDQQPRLSQTRTQPVHLWRMNKAIVGAYSPLYDYTWYGRDFVVSAEMRGGIKSQSRIPVVSGKPTYGHRLLQLR